MSLPYEDKIPNNKEAFIAKVYEVANKLSIPAEWLMVRMFKESGMRADIKNSIGCVGLIQFCPDKSGGTTKTINGKVYNLEDIRKMPNVVQMNIVYEYFKNNKSRLLSYHDLLLANLFPIAMGRDDTYVLEQLPRLKRDTVARQNPSYDVGKKGYITVGDVRQVGLSQFSGVTIPNLTKQEVYAIADKSADSVTKFATRNWLGIAITGIVVVAAGYGLWHYKSKLIKSASKIA